MTTTLRQRNYLNSITFFTSPECFALLQANHAPTSIFLSLIYFDNYIKFSHFPFPTNLTHSLKNFNSLPRLSPEQEREVSTLLYEIRLLKEYWFRYRHIPPIGDTTNTNVLRIFSDTLDRASSLESNWFRPYMNFVESSNANAASAVLSEKIKYYATMRAMRQ